MSEAPGECDPSLEGVVLEQNGQIVATGPTTVTTGPVVVTVSGQASNGVTVTARTPQGYKDYDAKAVIVAVPPWLAGAISYTSGVPGQPDLPARRLQLTQRMAMGTMSALSADPRS